VLRSLSVTMVLVVAACGDASTKDPNTQTQSPTTTSVPNAPDPSSSSSSSSSSGGGDTDAGGGVAACLAACEAKYPAGVPKGDAIDACWKQNCYDPCNGMAPSSTQFGAQHGACKYDVKTPAAACSLRRLSYLVTPASGLQYGVHVSATQPSRAAVTVLHAGAFA
jgi:hypothetical protein